MFQRGSWLGIPPVPPWTQNWTESWFPQLFLYVGNWSYLSHDPPPCSGQRVSLNWKWTLTPEVDWKSLTGEWPNTSLNSRSHIFQNPQELNTTGRYSKWREKFQQTVIKNEWSMEITTQLMTYMYCSSVSLIVLSNQLQHYNFKVYSLDIV